MKPKNSPLAVFVKFSTQPDTQSTALDAIQKYIVEFLSQQPALTANPLLTTQIGKLLQTLNALPN